MVTSNAFLKRILGIFLFVVVTRLALNLVFQVRNRNGLFHDEDAAEAG